jgi:hypothetical protein
LCGELTPLHLRLAEVMLGSQGPSA